jgi:hypothetical protein
MEAHYSDWPVSVVRKANIKLKKIWVPNGKPTLLLPHSSGLKVDWLVYQQLCVPSGLISPSVVSYSCSGLERPLGDSRVWGSQNFWTFGIWRWQICQPYSPTVFTGQEIHLVLICVQAESTPGPWRGRIKSMKSSMELNPQPYGS